MMFRIVSWSLILFACFWGIGSYPLLDNNEGMYASIARDMLASKQFIVPHLVSLPYIEKPPMLYWLMAGSMALFGVNEWAVRLVPALAYFLTTVSLKRFITRASGNEHTGFAAALMFTTSLPMLMLGREILCDMLVTCFFSAALFEFYKWCSRHPGAGRDPRLKTESLLKTDVDPGLRRDDGLLGFYTFLALAILTKGLTAIILAGGIIGVFYLWDKKPARLYVKTLSLTGLAIFFCIAAPWHIAASLHEQGFAWFYFINEHVLRFIDKREPHDYRTGSWWYYLPRIAGYLVAWTLFLLIFLRKPQPSASPTPSAERFLWSWFLVCLVFFSIAGSKANYYMVMGMPPLVGLTALRLKMAMDTGHRVVRSLTSGSFVLLLTLLWFTQHFCTENYGFLYSFCENVPQSYIISLALYSAACIVLCWRIPQYWLPVLLGTYVLLLIPLLISGVNNASEMLSQKSVAEYLQADASPQIGLYQDFESISALTFYLRKPMLIVDSRSDDLLYGQNRHVNPGMFLSLNGWAEHTPQLPMVVVKNKLFSLMNTLRSQHVDMQRVCITKRFDVVAIVSMCDHGH